jgi:hypothetical protein
MQQPSKQTLNNGATLFPWGVCRGVILKTIGATEQLQKKPNPSLLSKEEQRKKKKKNKSLDTEQIYGHGSQRGSMPRVTVLAGCQQ